MLIEDLLLLLYDPRTGRPLIRPGTIDLVLAGAALAELEERGRIRLTEPHRVTRNRTVVVVDPTPTGDDVLDAALRRIEARRPTRSQVVVTRISTGVRRRLLDRLTRRGLLRSEHGWFAGVIPTRAWPAVDPGRSVSLRHELGRVLRGERPPTPHEAVIISLLHGVRRTAVVVGDAGIGRRETARRARAIAEGDAAGEAVRRAVDAAAY